MNRSAHRREGLIFEGEDELPPEARALLHRLAQLHRRLNWLRRELLAGACVSLGAPLFALFYVAFDRVWLKWLVLFCIVLSVGLTRHAKRSTARTIREVNSVCHEFVQLARRR